LIYSCTALEYGIVEERRPPSHLGHRPHSRSHTSGRHALVELLQHRAHLLGHPCPRQSSGPTAAACPREDPRPNRSRRTHPPDRRLCTSSRSHSRPGRYVSTPDRGGLAPVQHRVNRRDHPVPPGARASTGSAAMVAGGLWASLSHFSAPFRTALGPSPNPGSEEDQAILHQPRYAPSFPTRTARRVQATTRLYLSNSTNSAARRGRPDVELPPNASPGGDTDPALVGGRFLVRRPVRPAAKPRRAINANGDERDPDRRREEPLHSVLVIHHGPRRPQQSAPGSPRAGAGDLPPSRGPPARTAPPPHSPAPRRSRLPLPLRGT